jgi:hypothetical protein
LAHITGISFCYSLFETFLFELTQIINDSPIYLYSMWWLAMLPDNTPQSRVECIAEFNRARKQPAFAQSLISGPISEKGMSYMIMLSRVATSAFILLTLDKDNELSLGSGEFS